MKKTLITVALIFSFGISKENRLVGKWTAKVTDSGFDYLALNSDKSYLNYSCKTNEIVKGKWSTKKDTLFLQNIESEYEDTERSLNTIHVYENTNDTLFFKFTKEIHGETHWLPKPEDSGKYYFTRSRGFKLKSDEGIRMKKAIEENLRFFPIKDAH